MNRHQDGFTLIEMIIVLIVIVVLTVLGTVGFSSYQVDARDTERKTDVEVLARGLEEYYKRGNPRITGDPGNISPGTYPGLDIITHIFGLDFCGQSQFVSAFGSTNCHIPGGYGPEAIPGYSDAARKGPGGSAATFTSTWLLNASQITDRIDKGAYMYDVFDKNNARCYGKPYENGPGVPSLPCTHFTISYKEESTGNIITIKSKHQ